MKYLLLIALVISAIILAGCGTGTKSITGTTIKTVEKSQASSGDMCFDSDNGINERIQGKVTGILNGQKYEIQDKCIRKHYVVEYYCEGNHYKNKNFVCQCMDGACHD